MSRYKAYAEYVPSEVEFLDSLPVGWRMLRGKYVFSEYSERSEYGEEQLLSVSEYYGVKPRGEVVEEGDFLSRAESLVGYKKCQKNDLVMNIMLAWKCGLGVSKYDGIVSPAYSVFRFNGNASPDYMHYLLRTDTYTGHFKTRSTGVIDSRLRLYPESFADVSLVLPSIKEQEKIVAFLDHETAKIDALIEKQQRLIELLKEKRQAVISHAVTKGLNPNAPMKDSGVEWLGDIPFDWECVRLKFASELSGGKVAPSNEERYVGLENVQSNSGKFIATEEVIPEGISNVFSRGDVLFGKLRPYLAKSWLADFSGICSSEFLVMTSRKVDSKFLHYFTLTEEFIKQVDSSTYGSKMPRASWDYIGLLNIPIPSHESEKIASFLDYETAKIDALIEKQLRLIELAKERRTALISAAVTGKIDVRDWQAAA